MSYRIKSTPFFQRMLSTSKLNGQLQMLKEEFERMHFFDDRNLEKKIKEVRLKRLFREVEELRELDSRKIKSDLKVKSRTKESERLENLKRAKSLGQYYSQRNGENVSVVASNSVLGDKRKILAQTKLKQKSSLKKGIKYGNEISDFNIQRIKLKNIRKDFIQEHIKNQGKSTKKEEKIKKKVFSNTVNKSSHNKEKSSTCHKNEPCPENISSVSSFSKNVHLIDLEKVDDNMFKSCTEMYDAILIDQANIQLMLSRSSRENIRNKRAVELWQKLSTLLRRQIMKREKSRTLQFLNSLKVKQSVRDFQLRSISNGTNLLETELIPSGVEQFNKNLIEKYEECHNERLINREYIFDAFSPKILDNELPRYPPPPPSPPPIIKPTFKNKKYPFQLNRELSTNNVENNSNDSAKQNFKLNVENLKSFFEHRSK